MVMNSVSLVCCPCCTVSNTSLKCPKNSSENNKPPTGFSVYLEIGKEQAGSWINNSCFGLLYLSALQNLCEYDGDQFKLLMG